MVIAGRAVVSQERDESHIEHLLGFLPERVARTRLRRGRHRDEQPGEGLDLEIGPDIVEGIVDKRAIGEERIERADLVSVVREHVADIEQKVALRVRDEQVAVHLTNVRLHVVACLAGTGAADDEHVHVSIVVHRESLSAPCSTRVLGKKKCVRGPFGVLIIDKWGEFLGSRPSRGAVFLADARVLLPVDQADHGERPRDADSEQHAEHPRVVHQKMERLTDDIAPHLRRGGRDALEHVRIRAGAVDEPVPEVGEGDGGDRGAQEWCHLLRDLHYRFTVSSETSFSAWAAERDATKAASSLLSLINSSTLRSFMLTGS